MGAALEQRAEELRRVSIEYSPDEPIRMHKNHRCSGVVEMQERIINPSGDISYFIHVRVGGNSGKIVTLRTTFNSAERFAQARKDLEAELLGLEASKAPVEAIFVRNNISLDLAALLLHGNGATYVKPGANARVGLVSTSYAGPLSA